MNKEIFDIVFCVDDKYSNYIAVTILSIVDNNPDNILNIHVITDSISNKNRKKLFELSNQYHNLDIKILIIDDSEINKLPSTNGWTSHTWYRFLIPKLLSSNISKVLYLDADTLVVGDLSPLFHLEMTDRSIAATPEANYFNIEYYKRLSYDISKGYICAGVMMMNLDYWRKHNITEESLNWAKNNRNLIKLLDQDVVNYICRDSKIILPLKYGVIQWYFTEENFYQDHYLEELKESVLNPVIIHYAFTHPWYKDYQRHIFHNLWISYNNRLKYPGTIKFRTKGILRLKIMFWNFFHSHEKRPGITKKEILNKIKDLSALV